MRKTWNYWIASLLFTLACTVINYTVFSFPVMIKLEFADSAELMDHLISPIGYHRLLMNTIVDYGFLTGYSLLTFFSFKIFLDVFQVAVKSWVYFLSFITGALDAIENIFLLSSGVNEKPVYSWVYCVVVRIKWAFSIIPFLLITIVIIYSLIVLFRARETRVKASA